MPSSRLRSSFTSGPPESPYRDAHRNKHQSSVVVAAAISPQPLATHRTRSGAPFVRAQLRIQLHPEPASTLGVRNRSQPRDLQLLRIRLEVRVYPLRYQDRVANRQRVTPAGENHIAAGLDVLVVERYAGDLWTDVLLQYSTSISRTLALTFAPNTNGSFSVTTPISCPFSF